jgi:hypothetical protein
MKTKTITTQEQLDNLFLIKENDFVIIESKEQLEIKHSIDVYGKLHINSSVVARGNSSVVARGNSSVEARGNSSVEAWENSSVVAWENSSVVARENSSVVARENSSVEAWGNSSVVAWGNSVVRLYSQAADITLRAFSVCFVNYSEIL